MAEQGMRRNIMNTGIRVRFSKYECTLYVGSYETGNLALVLFDVNTKEVVAVSTINLAPGTCYEDPFVDVAIKDYSENQGMFDALRKVGVISPPYASVQQGFVTIPICKYIGPLPEE